MKKLIVFIVLIVFVFSITSYSLDKVAQSGIKMFDVGAGARACGMGEAYTVVGQDADALFYNPSCIGEIDGNFDLSVGATQWFADINYGYLSVVYNAGIWGNFGISILGADYGDIYGTRIDTTVPFGFVNTGLIETSSYCVGIAYAREFTDKFTVGAQIKYAYQLLGASTDPVDSTLMRNNQVSVVAYDFGLLFYPGFKSFAFGMSIRNFSPRIRYEFYGFELPLTFALGIGLDLMDFLGEYPEYSFNIGMEMLHPRDWQEVYHVGGEFGYKDMFFLRAGYKFNYSQEGINAGVGFSFGGVRIDYSYSEFRLFDGMINRVSVGFDL